MTKILTNSGLWFDFVNPTVEQVCVHDIAHSLARTCRFGGHTFGHYSIAQHSMVVADLLVDQGPMTQLHGLLHDAHEAYIGDIVTPLKQLLDVSTIETDVQKAILAALVIPWPTDRQAAAVHAADKLAYDLERGAGLTAWPKDNDQIFVIELMPYEEAYAKFIQMLFELKKAGD